MFRSLLFTLWPTGLAVIIAALLEWQLPWRREVIDRLRWLHAGMLYIMSIVLTYLVLPIGSAGIALIAENGAWGLMNVVKPPTWLSFVIGIAILDLTQWVCHWTMHHWPILWRLHRLHHSDEVLDTSTAFRFHPAEALYRSLVQAVVILAFGIPVTAVAVSAVIILVFDVWEHTNTKFAKNFNMLSPIVITPDLHRIHHSSEVRHQNGNLGTIFSFWDRMFGTYLSASELSDNLAFGLGPQNQLSFKTLASLIIDPMRKA